MAVVFSSGSANGHEVIRVIFDRFLVPEDGGGHRELAETGHGMEKQGPVVVDVHGAQSDSEDTICPLEFHTMELVFGSQGIWEEIVVLKSEGGVLEEIVD